MLPSPMRALGRLAKEKSPDELHLAVLTGRTKKIKQLLRKGVHIESVNCHGQTPLFCASFGGDNEVVELLLKLGANPNRRCGGTGATPVHAAAYRGSRRVLRLLVDAGGDLSVRDNEILTPREYACKQPSPMRRQKILQFLDLLMAMTLHRGFGGYGRGSTSVAGYGMVSSTVSTNANTSRSKGIPPSPSSKTHTLTPNQGRPQQSPSNKNVTATKPVLGPKKSQHGSTASLVSRGSNHGSLTNVWAACVTETNSPSHHTTENDDLMPTNLHKTVSCHLLDQICVTTSLPLITPAELNRPTPPGTAYTCGGPTVYSPYTWLGTPVTVRRPTPAFSLPKKGTAKGEDDSGPDMDAVKSLIQELGVLRRLRHPAFLEVMAACHVTSPSPDHVTLVYQHVTHGSLYHHLHVQHRDLTVGGAVDILVGVAEALMFLHAHKWLHCGVSSHAFHLVSLNNAKLGGFEHALEVHTKGCSMKAEKLSRLSWLTPWHAPETVMENMVSTRSEVYGFAAIIWEIWAGMPPWSGMEESEMKRRVCDGETLPPLTCDPPSLITYLTQYGLKCNSHERELEFQEIHTMLRSLRIQGNENERVPAVTSWGPPSIPNTPVIGRQDAKLPGNSSPPIVSSAVTVKSNTPPSSSVSAPGCSTTSTTTITTTANSTAVSGSNSSYSNASVPIVPMRRRDRKLNYQNESYNIDNRKINIDNIDGTKHIKKSKVDVHQALVSSHPPDTVITSKNKNMSNDDKFQSRNSVPSGVPSLRKTVTSSDVAAGRRISSGSVRQSFVEGSIDSGFSTPCIHSPCPRTPSPINESRYPATLVTSTPVQATSSIINNNQRSELQPDLLPNKIFPQTFMRNTTPDILSQGPGKGPHPSSKNYRSDEFKPHYRKKKDDVSTFSINRSREPHPKNSSSSSSSSSSCHRKAIAQRKEGRALFSPTDTERHFRFSSHSKLPLSLPKHELNSASFSDEETTTNFGYISDRAKRDFLSREDNLSGDAALERPSSATQTGRLQQAVRRGLSLTNICVPVLTSPSATTVVTRTTSHISLSSSGSSANSTYVDFGRKPYRTVSQITLTLKKLSSVSDSSSSKENLSDPPKDKPQSMQRTRRSKSVPKITPNHTSRSPRVVVGRVSPGWDEITGIKPASHQLTRHSSSCSLASGPLSPTHHKHSGTRPGHSLLTAMALPNRRTPPTSANSSLPGSPTHESNKLQLHRPVSVCSTSSSGSGGGFIEGHGSKVSPRRYSEGSTPRTRRLRRQQEMDEMEDEFFDDEFNAALYEQPHMQLSVGSSENLLDSRMSHSLLADDSGGACGNISLRNFSPSTTTSSEDDDDGGGGTQSARLTYPKCKRTLNSLKETGDSDDEETFSVAKTNKKENVHLVVSDAIIYPKTSDINNINKNNIVNRYSNNEIMLNNKSNTSNTDTLSIILDKISIASGSSSDTDEVFSEISGYAEFKKDYEPLKSVELLKRLDKNFTTYLPTYSIGSDTETGEP